MPKMGVFRISEKDREIARIAKAYAQYLNGPFGKPVLQRLKEGESYSIRTSDKLIKITKELGKASIEVLKKPKEDEFLNYEPKE